MISYNYSAVHTNVPKIQQESSLSIFANQIVRTILNSQYK